MGFALGVGVGSVVSYIVLRNKFAQRLDREIQLIKEEKSKQKKVKKDKSNECNDGDNAKIAESSCDFTKEDKKQYEDYTKYYKSNDSTIIEQDEAPAPVINTQPPIVKKPYVITPEDFGSMGYEEISLTYYADGVLTEEGEPKKLSIKKTIGASNVKHFGEHADDALYVRNEDLRVDYEVLKDKRAYDEVFGQSNNTDGEE